MSTPQGPQPPHGTPQQPAEQPAWGQQPPGGWGAPPEGQQGRPAEETRVVPHQVWNAPETSEVPQQGPPDRSQEAAAAAAAPEQPQRDPQGGAAAERTQAVAPHGEQQAWNGEETRAVPQQSEQPASVDPAGTPAPQQQAWNPSEQTQVAAPPYASPQQHYGSQPPAPSQAQPYPGQQPGQPGQPPHAPEHPPAPAGQQQAPSPYAPPGQQPAAPYAQQQGPYGQPQSGYGQPAFGQAPPQQPGQPQGQAYGQQPTQVFGQPQFGQQGQQSQPGQQAYGGAAPYGQQQAAWSGQQAGWGQGAPGQQPTQQWGGGPQEAQQQWGGGYPGLPDSPPAPGGSKSRTPLFIGIGAVVLVLALVGVLGFVSPGFFNTRVLDAAAVQEGVQQVLTQDYGLEVEAVTCAEGVEVAAGATFECQATVDGEAVAVPIVITSDDGNYEVGRPL